MRGFRLVLGVGSWQSAVGSFADGCMTPHPAFGHPLPEGEGINILLPGEKVPAGRMRGSLQPTSRQASSLRLSTADCTDCQLLRPGEKVPRRGG